MIKSRSNSKSKYKSFFCYSALMIFPPIILRILAFLTTLIPHEYAFNSPIFWIDLTVSTGVLVIGWITLLGALSDAVGIPIASVCRKSDVKARTRLSRREKDALKDIAKKLLKPSVTKDLNIPALIGFLENELTDEQIKQLKAMLNFYMKARVSCVSATSLQLA